MAIPHDFMSLVKGRAASFRVSITRGGLAEDVSTWSNFWFGAKRNSADPDADLIFEKVYFAGVEVITPAEGLIEVTIDTADWSELPASGRDNLLGMVGGTDGDFKNWEVLALTITTFPPVRRSTA